MSQQFTSVAAENGKGIGLQAVMAVTGTFKEIVIFGWQACSLYFNYYFYTIEIILLQESL